MAKPAVRLRVVEHGVFVALALLAVRAAQVQLLEGRRWAEEAQAQRTERIVLQARRGTLSDRHGTPLALTQETYHVGVAPNELRDPVKDGAVIARQLGLSARAWQQALRRRYAYFAGPFSALEVQPLRSTRGVHLEAVVNRFYPAPQLARATIGRVGDDGYGASGMEKTLDSLLAGRPGSAVVLKDRAGREYESPARVIAQPVAGHDVVLTLDAELQEIAQRALDDALRRMDADGGDVVMLDPASGEVLAIASHQRDGTARPSAFIDTFEPGSVAKIFAAAALLALKRVRPGEHVSGEDGIYRLPGRPPIREVRSPEGRLLYRHEPEPVRRAVSPEIAAALRDLLRGVVEHGTGSEAALTTFPVAAKTGTARRVVNGHYAPGQYTASFAALFPADKPQLVLVVKIDNPHKGSYFAAQTAAPVTRSMLEQALAARTVALDRARLSTAAPPTAAVPLEADGGVVPYVVPWPYQPDSVGAARRQKVPDVTGLRLREAVRALHRRGFRVALKGWGTAEHTWPAAGDSAALGATVTLFAERVSPAAISVLVRRRAMRRAASPSW